MWGGCLTSLEDSGGTGEREELGWIYLDFVYLERFIDERWHNIQHIFISSCKGVNVFCFGSGLWIAAYTNTTALHMGVHP